VLPGSTIFAELVARLLAFNGFDRIYAAKTRISVLPGSIFFAVSIAGRAVWYDIGKKARGIVRARGGVK